MVLLAAGAATFAISALVVRGGAPAWDARLFLGLNDVSPVAENVLTPLSRAFLPAGLAVAIALAVLYVSRRNRSMLPVLVGVSAGVAAWVLASVAKAAADRPRPYEVLADAVLRQQPARGTSFPSSHTAVALAIVIALLPFVSRPVAIAAMVFAVLVGWSRIYLGVHYPLDVLGGAGIGLAVGGLCLLALGRLLAGSEIDDRIPQDLGPPSSAPSR